MERHSPARQPDWSVAIFSARESTEILRRALEALVTACGERPAIVDLLINGNSSSSAEMASVIDELPIGPAIGIRVWDFPVPDKAETWNIYLHDVSPDAGIAFFVDGYVAVEPESLSLLANELNRIPAANCATGVPSDGWSAKSLRKEMLRKHGIHGNLYALPSRVMRDLRSIRFRLPRGIYRNDGLLGAVLAFSMDPQHNDWSASKLLVVPGVTWHLPTKRWWSFSNLQSRWRRRIRQARGNFEIQAFRQHLAVERRTPASLPGSVKEMVTAWMKANPLEVVKMTRFSWRHRVALKELLAQRVPESFERGGKLLKSRNLSH